MKLYLITTRKFCAGVVVKDGYICDSAPCFKWAVKRKMTFENFKNFLKRKNDLINIALAM